MIQDIGIGSYNEPILLWMIDHRELFTVNVMKTFAFATDPIVIAIVVSAAAAYWGYLKREIWRPFLLISTVALTAGITTFIKVITENMRPPVSEMVAPLELDYSFPSGHTLIVIICLLLIGYFICSRGASAKCTAIWATTVVIGVSVIAFSRLYLGYHWLTDIIASVGLGFMIFAAVVVIDMIFRSDIKKLKY
jgi:undecaprenyl-diphosphatase